MPRVKNSVSTRRRRKRILKQAKGYFGHKRIGFRTAKEQVYRSYEYAFAHRKQNKRNFRRLWITRISAITRANNINYSTFMNGLKIANVDLNRKMLSEIAIHNPQDFLELIEISKKALLSKDKDKK